jgi:DNA repair exonuclease SbcCD nuclease subunit
VKVLITSDWHLDAVTAGVPRYEDLKRALNEVWEAMGGVDAFLFLGDLCNPGTGRCHRAVAAATKFVEGLDSSMTPSLWLTGNHDVVEDGHGSHTLMPLASMRERHHVIADAPGRYEVGGLGVLALPFTPRSHAYDPEEVVETASSNASTIDVVVGHLNVEGIGPGSETKDMPRGREVFFPYDLLRKRFPKALLLNGHYHEGQVWKKGKAKQGVHVPGSLERLTFGEQANAPGWIVAEKKAKTWKVSRIDRSPLARSLITIGPGDSAWEAGDVPSAIGDGIIRVQPPAGADPERVDRMEADMWAGGAYAVKVLPPEPGGEVVTKGGKPKENWGLRPRRELVGAMVAEANSKDPKALVALVGEVMDEEQL